MCWGYYNYITELSARPYVVTYLRQCPQDCREICEVIEFRNCTHTFGSYFKMDCVFKRFPFVFVAESNNILAQADTRRFAKSCKSSTDKTLILQIYTQSKLKNLQERPKICKRAQNCLKTTTKNTLKCI